MTTDKALCTHGFKPMHFHDKCPDCTKPEPQSPGAVRRWTINRVRDEDGQVGMYDASAARFRGGEKFVHIEKQFVLASDHDATVVNERLLLEAERQQNAGLLEVIKRHVAALASREAEIADLLAGCDADALVIGVAGAENKKLRRELDSLRSSNEALRALMERVITEISADASGRVWTCLDDLCAALRGDEGE